MTDRFLCRGKRLDGEWVHGHYYIDLISKQHKQHTIQGTRGFWTVDPVTVGQCIGLRDKNGTLIFEGDIVTFGQRKYQIHFEVGSFALLDKDGGMISKIGGHNDYCYSLMPLYDDCCWEDDCAFDLEIIGNIHDNGDLLEST